MISINLFKNDYKQTDNQPDYKGKAKDGSTVAGWLKKDKNGASYISLCFKTAEENAEYKNNSQQPQSNSGAYDDDVPF